LDNKVFDIIDTRCNHEVYSGKISGYVKIILCTHRGSVVLEFQHFRQLLGVYLKRIWLQMI